MSWFGLRIRRPLQPPSAAWQHHSIEPRGSTRLGISFRSPQIDALGLDARQTLGTLLALPFEIIRLGAYWRRIEPRHAVFMTDELDWQVDAAEGAAKQIILCVGALKTFGYPEFFVPDHRLGRPLPEGKRIRRDKYRALADAACEFVTKIVERYRDRPGVVAWQVEHEPVDPLGFEHSWRLDTSFVQHEIAAVRQADSSRPVLINAYLPASTLAGVTQWWRTRDQGDSLALALRAADIVGLDHYPRHALVGVGGWTVYLDGNGQWFKRALAEVFSRARRVMVTEAQAEPWEAVTVPPNPRGWTAYSCPPEQIVGNYNAWMRWAHAAGVSLEAYLFWGAEYWVLRQLSGDPSYLETFERILARS